jgi:acyl transferase domain-containing protein/thioesterase domain-containing protein/NADP-dependent 3-hydroxy acid dehydrogenase YdfG
MAEQENYGNDVAIVGIATRLPGAPDARAYWANLVRGIESIRTYDDEALIAAGESRERLRDPRYVRAGAPLDGMELFDGEFFGFSPKDSAILDPQHRHFFEVCWEALESAGHPPERFEGPIGVWAGCGMGSYLYFNLCSNRELVRDVGMFLLRHTGNDKDFLATRVSYLLDLHGPAVGVQTACSTSLVAVHLACQSLLAREVDMAIAGGVTIELPHRRGYVHQEGEILSPDGHCHAFDHRAEGTVFGSGAGSVVLRRLADALRDGDPIRAVIKGSAINNDGASKVNYLAPSVDGQAACMAEAYALSGISPESIAYVECHGTGTYLGDPIEITALTQAFRRETQKVGFCRVGSVKTNIGHTDTAAGVASLAKAALALENRQIPATLGYEKPNPAIAFEGSPFVVNDRLTEWPRGEHPRRCAVNSLGVGGTNAHVVLEEAPARAASGPSRAVQLLTISGRNLGAVDGNARRLAEHLRGAGKGTPLADVAYTLHVGRRSFAKRRVVAAKTHEEAAQLLADSDPRRVFTHAAIDRPKVAFLLPGGGAQHPQMARGLYAASASFRREMDRGFAWLRANAGIDLASVLFSFDGARLDEMPHQLPATFLVEHALAQLWAEHGVEPESLLGHSLGENTAACLAGVMTFEECLGLVLLRGRLFARVSGGGMLSVSLPEAELRAILPDALDVAVVNVADVTVVSGPLDALAPFEAWLAQRDIEHRRLAIPVAAHSRALDPILGELEAYVRTLRLRAPRIPFLSNVTGTWITDAQATDPAYWATHLRSTVRFERDLGVLLADPERVLIEIGPGRALTSFARQHPACGVERSVFGSMRHRDDDVDDEIFFQTAIGRAWASGIDRAVEGLWRGEVRHRVDLPTYAFQHQRYFIEPSASAAIDEPARTLEKISELAEWGYQPIFRRALPPQPALAKTTWLVFLDGTGIGHRLVERIASRGHRVVTVVEGDAFQALGPDRFSLAPEGGKEAYAALLRALAQQGLAPTRIAHLWMLTVDETFRPGSSFFHRNQERGFYSLLFLAQAIAEGGLPMPVHATVVANGMQAVAGEPLPYPEKATLLGPVKVIPRELPGFTCASVDVALPAFEAPTVRERVRAALAEPERPRFLTTERDALVARLELEVSGPAENASVALRGPDRFVESIERLPLPPRDAHVVGRVRNGAVVLITGGLGGLGLLFAKHLATTRRAKLVLVGRSDLPPASDWDEHLRTFGDDDKTSRRIRAVRALEEAGAEVMVASCDVTVEEEVREVVETARSRFGAIHAVLHAAGIVSDGLIATKTQGQCEDVFTPKIHGTLVLERVLAKEPLDLFLAFSSTSVLTAPAGQVDYVAANAFLDAFATSRRGSTRAQVTALAWGIWKDVGMAEETLLERTRPSRFQIVGRATQPLLDATTRDRGGHRGVLARWSPSTHWLLDEHRTLRGDALVPGTGYFELVREALNELGEGGSFAIEDIVFLRPLQVPDDEVREVHVDLKRSDRGYSLEVRSRRRLGGRVGWELHAQGSVVLGALAPAATLDLSSVAARCGERRQSAVEGLRSPQERHLRFGPRWRVLRDIQWGRSEALAELSIDPRFAPEIEDIELHPALLDLATGYAMDLVPGYDAASLYVPVGYERATIRAPLTRGIRSWVRLVPGSGDAEFASFDVTVTDLTGRILFEAHRFSIKRMASDVDFARSRDPIGSEIAWEDTDRGLSPAEERLRQNLARGITPDEGTEALDRVLSMPSVDRIAVSSLDLDGLIRQAGSADAPRESSAALFDRPALDSSYVEPRDDLERTLVGLFQDLLGVKTVGVQDGFFELGGHSLIAVRLFASIKRTYKVDFPISLLFEAPTVERIAARIRERVGPVEAASDYGKPQASARPVAAAETRYRHLVAMHPGEGGPAIPFFLVAGMFGNVLNLRHLAHLVGADRRFYGLQARGLYGAEPPHATFPEAADAYLEEIRTVQPHGPYFLGGFSGGGLTALEMAQKLRKSGEEVALLAMLDTPLPNRPRLSAKHRAAIQWLDLTRGGPAYVSRWAERRVRWEVSRMERLFGGAVESGEAQFHDKAIEAAFRAALPLYQVVEYDGYVALFRPAPHPTWTLADGTMIDANREYILPDNGWSPFVTTLDVFEVPGDHDSMVLEPNVRVLARRLRRLIEAREPRRSPLRLQRNEAPEAITTERLAAE